MTQREVKISNVYRWWRNDDKPIKQKHIEELDSEAERRIEEMTREGYTSGELICDIDNIEYRGWWERGTETL